ncbi:hypothetical protein DWY02_13920 [Eubacterium sp. AF22-9]|nr:hypothetical protein DWY02_13920 [Eubacterium sp. AF22-9]
MKSYVIMPGVVYSDRVIVQSENIKNSDRVIVQSENIKNYILENLFSFTEKKQDKQWDNKLCTLEHIN